MNFSHILSESLPVPEKLTSFGFTQKQPDTFTCRKPVPESEFYAEITLTQKNLTAEVYETESNEKYALFDVPSSNGKFVTELREKVQKIMNQLQSECFETSEIKTQYITFLEKKFEVKAEFPWNDLPDYAVFRCKNQKWFALVMKIKFRQLGLESDENVWVVNLKADSARIPEITDRKSIFPAYHMNKKYWITVLLTSVTNFSTLCELTNQSFALVNGKK